ncbi:MAG TPA: pantoate--beta-alanine ligase [Bryobacteraceae bacterium]|nr:pantoate--beta-alanine ligase [Bryobacteraceae bacterium]
MMCARTIAEARRALAEARRAGGVLGFVPTMGALHAGHGALLERARRECAFVAASIFVNPTQFDRREDFEAYHINLNHDLEFCRRAGAGLVFAPAAEEMYPAPLETRVEVAPLSDHLCGKFRPGHFRGVATVVAKLFHIVMPDRAYFGEKDGQQLAIIRRMVSDLNVAVEIIAVPTVREPDGLAISSRNRRLTPEERAAAPVVYRALRLAARRAAEGCGCAAEIRQVALAELASETRARVEYLEVVDAETMAPIEKVLGPARIAAAVWFGATRLIDNISCG